MKSKQIQRNAGKIGVPELNLHPAQYRFRRFSSNFFNRLYYFYCFWSLVNLIGLVVRIKLIKYFKRHTLLDEV